MESWDISKCVLVFQMLLFFFQLRVCVHFTEMKGKMC